MHNVTDIQTDDRMIPIADRTVLQYDRLKCTKTIINIKRSVKRKERQTLTSKPPKTGLDLRL